MSSNESGMSRSEQKQLSRQKLLDATIDIAAEEGLSSITFAKVSARASLSRGLCSFHFDSKEHLLLETFRLLYRQYEQAWQAALNEPGASPEKRLTGLIEALLSPPVADPRTLSVLVAFWGIASYRQTYLELCTESDRAYEQAVENVLREMSGNREVINGLSLQAISVILTSMIDGVHVQFLIAPGRLSGEEGIVGLKVLLKGFFPDFDSERQT